MRSFLFSGRNQDTARRVALQGRKERKVFMKKALLIVAMLLLVATPVMATTTITAVQEGEFTADGTKQRTVSIVYTSDVDVRAFALDITIDAGPTFDSIRDFKTGESNAVSPGYGIFPSRFRDFIVVTGPNWVDINYNPTVAWNEPESANTGMGYPKMIVEMGTLYAGDANKPALTGTLFRFDVNSEKNVGTFNITIAANALRGGVVGNDGSSITPTFVGTGIVFAEDCVNILDEVGAAQATAETAWTGQGFGVNGTGVVNCAQVGLVISQDTGCQNPGYVVNYTYGIQATVPNVVNTPEASATANIIAAGLTLGARTTAGHNTIIAGNVISTNPVAGTVTCTPVAYVVSTGPCVVPNVVNNMLESPIMNPTTNARSTLTNAGFTIGTRTTATHASIIAGRLISTTPAALATPGCGTPVAYVVSTGKGVCATCPGDIAPDSIKQATDISLLQSKLVTAYNRTGFYKATKGNIDTGDLWNICGDIAPDSALQATDISLLQSQLVAGYNAGGFYKAPFVPNVVTPVKTRAQACAAITTAKLVCNPTDISQCSNTVPAGSVISSNPAYPTYRNCNTSVQLTVSTGPCP